MMANWESAGLKLCMLSYSMSDLHNCTVQTETRKVAARTQLGFLDISTARHHPSSITIYSALETDKSSYSAEMNSWMERNI